MPIDLDADARRAATAAYRSASSSTTDERHDSLVQPPAKRPMKTIEDALRSVIDECQRDTFWADIAKPAELAIEHLKTAAAATSGRSTLYAETAAKARSKALQLLHHLDEQMQSASKANLFVEEARMVQLVVQAIDADPTLGPSSPLSAIAAAVHREQAAASENSRHNEATMAASSQEQLERVRTAMVPYTFVQTADAPEMTVSIAVPAVTRRGDVSVRLTRDTLVVTVAGHALQPSVIDGRFLHPVDHESSDWHLEGSGEGRVLILDCEKVSPGLDWSQGLLAIGRSGGADAR